MQRLRHARLITRWVLAGFAWVVAASLLSPLLRGGGELQILCSAMGVVMVDDGSSGAQPGGSTGSAVKATGLDCPLCLPMLTLPAQPTVQAVVDRGLSHALRPIVSAQLVWLARSPMPARGPPAALPVSPDRA
ncbi:MAG TPA: DUF2946 domain-containing protein [Burkholderiaceae bacterium]|nr:DUF2946 domain-containing protein [Burkholderiaceae bacterium]HMZ01490.1 DUF2946 domain-containing protein [Burkholderiaceae bacterium]HNB43201.1 DUF2946 domain-containing protein [Burkholderiaceae bacterium]HNG82825.1 DUF2946 domain-containing protein [Burkholderiaceae bacterium]